MNPLYTWQAKALETWHGLAHSDDQRMTIQAVTGAGKTRVALEIIADWAQRHPHGQVTIIVPRRPLLTQWRDVVTAAGFSDIGRVGGGHIGGWPDRPANSINIATIQTMSRGRRDFLRPNVPHLLIVDECHNLRGEQYRKAAEIPSAASLGLSATPDLDEAAHEAVVAACGPIRVRYGYTQALQEGVVPPFRLVFIRTPLSLEERGAYNKLTRRIHASLKGTQRGTPTQRREAELEVKWLARMRKAKVNQCKSRFPAALQILKSHPDVPTMLFHERTEGVDALASQVPDLDVAVYHSKRVDGLEQLRRFQARETNHLFSCLALAEGFNAPHVEVAVMVSGPNAPLRRIQTLGRCLRGSLDRPSTIYFLYSPDTTDERGILNLLAEGSIPSQVQINGRTIQIIDHVELDTAGNLQPSTVPLPQHTQSGREEFRAPKHHQSPEPVAYTLPTRVSIQGHSFQVSTRKDYTEAPNEAPYPDDMQWNRWEATWMCQWCDTQLHGDGTVDDGCWSLGDCEAPSHFLECSTCATTAPDCQGLTCDCAQEVAA